MITRKIVKTRNVREEIRHGDYTRERYAEIELTPAGLVELLSGSPYCRGGAPSSDDPHIVEAAKELRETGRAEYGWHTFVVTLHADPELCNDPDDGFSHPWEIVEPEPEPEPEPVDGTEPEPVHDRSQAAVAELRRVIPPGAVVVSRTVQTVNGARFLSLTAGGYDITEKVADAVPGYKFDKWSRCLMLGVSDSYARRVSLLVGKLAAGLFGNPQALHYHAA
jgi:hypothetical protein